MKMSVSRQLGFVQVRGGRVMIVTCAHEVPTSSYNRVPDTARGRQHPRVFDSKSVVAQVRDLAIEIIGVATERLLGFGYLSGPAINLCRYVSDDDRDQVLGWMTVGSGTRFTLPDPVTRTAEAISAIQRATYSGADMAVSRCTLTGPGGLYEFSQIFEASRDPAGMTPTTDILIKVTLPGHLRQSACMHCQIPRRSQQEACQPFFHELLYSSPQVVEAS